MRGPPVIGMVLIAVKADYFRCTMAAQRGWNIKETVEKLLEVSAKSQERARLHDKGYARVTAENAAVAAETGQMRGSGLRPEASLTAPPLNCTVHITEMESLCLPPPQPRARMAP